MAALRVKAKQRLPMVSGSAAVQLLEPLHTCTVVVQCKHQWTVLIVEEALPWQRGIQNLGVFVELRVYDSKKRKSSQRQLSILAHELRR